MGELVRTVKQTFHWLRTNPRFAIPAVLLLALGLGGGVAMFSITDRPSYPPLPYRDPSRVMIARMYQPGTNAYTPQATGDYNDFKALNTVFESTGLFLPLSQPTTITGGGNADRVLYQHVTASMFPLLGVRAKIGRTFEDADARTPSVLLSDAFWKRRFNADPNVIGKPLHLGGTSYTVLGVMPEDFHIGGVKTDVWRQTEPTGILNDRRVRWLMFAGRLKPGVTIAQAQADMSAIAQQLAGSHPATNRGWEVRVSPLGEYGAPARRTGGMHGAGDAH